MGLQLSGSSKITIPRSISTFGQYLYGDCLFYDGFESTLVKWLESDIAGGGGTVSRDTTAAVAGEASLKIVTAAAANDECAASADFGGYPIGASGIITVSAFVRIGEAMAAAGDYVQLDFYHRNSVSSYPFRVKFLCTAANVYKLQYQSVATFYDLITGLTSQTGNHWLQIEMKFDVVNHTWISIGFGGLTYPLTAACSTLSASTIPWSSVLFDVQTEAAAAKTAYIDEVMVRMV